VVAARVRRHAGSVLHLGQHRRRAASSTAATGLGGGDEGQAGLVPERGGVNLTRCEEEEDVSGVLAELGSMPSLRSLELPSSCAQRAVDAEAVCGLTTLTTLCFDRNGVVGEWVLDLSRLTTLTTLRLWRCFAVKDKQVLELSHLTA
jgi:hypothetical protein